MATALLLAATQWSATQAAPPKQSLVGQSTVTRGGGAPVYFAVTDPVDVSNDGLKRSVQLIVVDVAKINGGLDFSTTDFDDELVGAGNFLSRG